MVWCEGTRYMSPIAILVELKRVRDGNLPPISGIYIPLVLAGEPTGPVMGLRVDG